MMRQARNRNCCFACRNRGRHAPRARGGPRGEGEGAQAQRAHVAQNDSESSTGRGGKRPVLGRVKRGEPLESVCPRVILYDVYYPVSRIIFLPFPNVSRETFVRLPAAPHGATRGPARARAALPPSGTRAMCLLPNLRVIRSTCYYGNSQYREELQWRTRAWPRIMPISACS